LIQASPNATLTEREAKAVLAAYGVPVVRDAVVRSAEDAARAAAEAGFPVALKVESADIPHKTEAGVIRLNLCTAAEVREAFAQVMANAVRVVAPDRIHGVLVQPMVPPGVEVMVGARVDPQFGPMVVVGLGGIFVEVLRDTSARLAPVDATEARRMLGELKAQALLRGFRGAQPVDLDALAAVIARVSEFASDQRELVAELDINPLICAGERIVAVDALIARKRDRR
jgi:acyl-CoA synthetase (NDP forming)